MAATDASKHFSSKILPYVERLVSGTSNQDEIAATLERAKIIDKGRITAEHSWLAPRVEAWRNSEDNADRPSQSLTMPARKKRVLLLGSGLVAGPAVDVFVARRDIELVIGQSRLYEASRPILTGLASNNMREAQLLAADRPNISVKQLDVSDQQALSEVVASSDVVVR